METYAISILAVSLVIIAGIGGVAANPDLRFATGDSMHPTMHSPVIAHCDSDLASGVAVDDIAAVHHGDRVTIHRVTAIDDGNVLTRGDGNDRHDGWASIDDVACVVTDWWSLNPSAYY